MKKILILLLISVLSISMVIAGISCKKEEVSAAGETTSEGKETGKAEEETVTEVKTLTVMRTGTPEVVREFLEPIIASYEAENPDIKVDLVDFGWADAEKKLPVMASTKTLPDIMYHLPGHIFEMAEAGLIVDLNQYIDDELKNDLYPSMLEAGQYKGSQYMITCSGSTLLLWYSTKIFEQAGLDPNAPPKDWDELLAFAKQIKENTEIPGIGAYAKSAGETSMVFESLFATALGGPTWNAVEEEYTYFYPENVAAAVDALTLMSDLVPFSQGNVVELGRFDGRTLLRDGKIAMELDLINMKNQTEEQLQSGEIKVALLPMMGPSGKSASAIDVGGWYIPTNSKYPEEAWKLLRYFMNTENQVAHTTTYGSVPILKSEAETYTGEFWDVIKQSVASSYPQGMIPGQQALWDASFEQLQLMYLGEQTPEQTIDNIINKQKEILSD